MPSDVMMLIGRIDERTATTADRVEQTFERLDRIDGRLAAGDARMNSIDTKISGLELSQSSLPNLEKVLKSSLVWILVSVAIAILGESEPVIRILEATGKVLAAARSVGG